jgi:hypothetical protein
MNGAVIPNATNSILQFSAVTPQDAGSYSVVITNAYASVTSSVARMLIGFVAQNFDITEFSNQSVQLTFTGLANCPYAIQSATNLNPPVAWEALITSVSDSNGNWTFVDTNTINYPAKFYRLQIQ